MKFDQFFLTMPDDKHIDEVTIDNILPFLSYS